ncbi:hypothetical protein Hanom_Chr16g01438481 [Helianthus anomalus]
MEDLCLPWSFRSLLTGLSPSIAFLKKNYHCNVFVRYIFQPNIYCITSQSCLPNNSNIFSFGQSCLPYHANIIQKNATKIE